MATKNTEVPLEKPVQDDTQTAARLDTIEGRVNALEGAKDDAGDRESAKDEALSDMSEKLRSHEGRLNDTGDDGFVTRASLDALEKRLAAIETANSSGDEFAKLGDFDALRDEVAALNDKTVALTENAAKTQRDGPHRSTDTLPRTEDL